MNAEVSDPLILVDRVGAITRVTLNRPRAINALNTEMFEGLDAALDAAAGSNAIVLDGAGERGFCGGGDIKQIAFGGDPRGLFGAEYRVDYRMSASPVPVVALMDGIAMGGGIGLGGHAAFRIVTERSRLAMPEVRIGIAPDVGGHLLLAEAPGRLGEYLAITAGEMTAGDAIALGFADTLVPSDRLDDLRAALAAGGDIAATIAQFAEPAPTSPLIAVRDWFDPIADAALARVDAVTDPVGAAVALVTALETSEDERARETAAVVRGMCPLSLAVTVSQIARTRAESLDVAAVLEDDYRIVPRFAVNPNFAEGVRAQLVDKDRNPKWIPATVEALDPAVVAALLAPLEPGESGLGLPARS
ncbi:enoyl-CoA hydratase/isomerase family protein [Leucobacter albus]|uniref:3-hydroxyisobutyryl-CoA hydrolase n=1 Tax=Leucobacter albus TaxID=272210 RepID=A0ABW3TQ72_9MICO